MQWLRIHIIWCGSALERSGSGWILLIFMLKLDEQFRDKKILIISFFQQFRFGFWEQKKILVFFGLYLAPRIRIRGSAYLCGSGSGSRTPKWYHRIGLFLWFPFIFQNLKSSVITWKPWNNCRQCLGSGFGSVGSARFWLPGSGSAKICGSKDPDPRGKISTKNCKKKILLNYWKKRYRDI